MKRTYFYLLPLLFIIIGGAIIGTFYPHGKLAIKSSKWPSVEGIIEKSKVIYLGRNTASKKFFEYSFFINGESYFGNTAFYGQAFSTSSKSLEFSQKYKLSSKVNVYYNPDHPAQSVIEPGLKMAALFLPGIGLAFFGGGLLFFFFIRLEQKSPFTVNRPVHKPTKYQITSSLIPEKTKISIVETPHGFTMTIPFNKWKKTPIIFLFFGISIWSLIGGGFFIPFLLPAIVLAHIILCMLFGRWKIIAHNNTLTIKTGFLYLSWQASIPIRSIKTIVLQESKTFSTHAEIPDEIKIVSPNIECKTSLLISKVLGKKHAKLCKLGYYPFGAIMSDEQKIETIDYLIDNTSQH